MSGDADAADPAELDERENQIVVACIQIESLRDHVAGSIERRLRLLDGRDVGDLRERRDRLRLGVDDDAARDVVEHDRPIGGGGDRLDVRDDASLGGCCSTASERNP